MRIIRTSLVAFVGLAIAGAAFADPPTGSRVDRAPSGAVTARDVAGENAADIAMSRFSRCAAKRDRKRAEALLALPFQSNEQETAAKVFAQKSSSCLDVAGSRLGFGLTAFAGGIAEALVEADHLKVQASLLRPIEEASFATAGVVPRTLAEDFSQCVVAKAPATALSLIRSEIASDAEAEFVKQLTPFLGPCLTSNSTLTLNTRSVRLMLAVGVYRLMPILAANAAKVD